MQLANRQCTSAAVGRRSTSRRPARLVRVSAAAPATEQLPPSSRTAANELQALARYSTIVPDSLQYDAPGKLAAATVGYNVMNSIAKSQSLGFQPLKNAIATALTWDGCAALKDPKARLECSVDKAMANVGALLLAQVADGGRVATQLDPRLAGDAAGLVAKARTLSKLYTDMGVPADRLVFRLPATWASLQAAKQLEASGIATQVYNVYSLAQGAAAMQAGVSVLQVAVGTTREWYDKNPGAIRDPKGPRQDAGGLVGGTDPGLRLAEQLYAYARVYHPGTRIMASAIRSREDALALAGIDWIVMPRRVAEALAATPTIQGYNSGLSALNTADAGDGLEPTLTPEAAKKAAPAKIAPFATEAEYRSALGPCAEQLSASSIKGQIGDVEALLSVLKSMAGGME